MSGERHMYDGKPFYCAWCGAGFDEYLACEEPQCQLESLDAAIARQQAEADGE